MMKKSLKFFVMAVMAITAACVVSSCDSDNVDELTSMIWDKTWVSDTGEVYTFYKTFSGVIYAGGEDYKKGEIDKSFVWTVTDSRMTFAIDGYRLADGKWKDLTSDELQTTVYEVTSDNNRLTLKSAAHTIILTIKAN